MGSVSISVQRVQWIMALAFAAVAGCLIVCWIGKSRLAVLLPEGGDGRHSAGLIGLFTLSMEHPWEAI
jgi:hypothetical protein